MMEHAFSLRSGAGRRIVHLVQQKPWLRDIVLLAVLISLGSAVALMIHPTRLSSSDVVVAAVILEQEEIPTGEEGAARLRQMARNRLQTTLMLKSGPTSYRTSWAQMGTQAEIAGLERILRELSIPGSPASRYYQAKMRRGTPITLNLPLRLDSTASVEALVAIKEKLDLEPVNARFDFVNDQVLPGKSGISLDIYGTLFRMDAALRSGVNEVDMLAQEILPDIREEELIGIDVSDVAGYFETRYSRMKKDVDRTHNLILGASYLDGYVIRPGDMFSFNETVGDRTEARGFRYAPVIAAGKIVEGMGGGACQLASTLYAAAFFGGLIIEERFPHSRPSSYIKLGLDATVSYPTKDLKIRNPLPWPVVIHFSTADGIARAEFRGKERPFTVTLLRKVVNRTDYPVRVVDNEALLKGNDVITQRGIPGYRAKRYRIIERGKVAYLFQSFDVYPPTIEFVHRGTATPESLKKTTKKPPPPDTHNPYRAPDSLRMVQGSDVWYERSRQ